MNHNAKETRLGPWKTQSSVLSFQKETLFFISSGVSRGRQSSAATGPHVRLLHFANAVHPKCAPRSYRVQQRGSHVLPVAVPQAGPAELSSDPAAALVPTHRLGVNGLLPALVASVSLREEGGGRVSAGLTGRCLQDPKLSNTFNRACRGRASRPEASSPSSLVQTTALGPEKPIRAAKTEWGA